jgi:hypothetical protein
MAPGAHTFLSWWTANVFPLERRDRFLVFAGGILPDLDGLGLFFSLEAYLTYHHILCHNLFACLGWVALVALLARNRRVCVIQCALNWHLHLACDYFGSRAADSPPWVLPYLFPLLGSWTGNDFNRGPRWYWNSWQWELNAWPNLVITLLGLLGWFYIAVRLDRTFMEFVWPRQDAIFCQRLRDLLGAKQAIGWSEGETKAVRRGYLAIMVVVFLACVVAASKS